MTTLLILGQSALLLTILLAALLRPGACSQSAIRRRLVAPVPPRSTGHSTLAGVPLRTLLDERCGPGAVMSDTLRIHPSDHY